MGKRFVATGLWFLAVWCVYELAWSLTGVPRPVGPILATTVAVFVGADPLHLVWSRGRDLEKETQSARASRPRLSRAGSSSPAP